VLLCFLQYPLFIDEIDVFSLLSDIRAGGETCLPAGRLVDEVVL
jgi:hypothetical protein